MKTKGIDRADYFKFTSAGSNTAVNNTITTTATTTTTRNSNIDNPLFPRKPLDLRPLHWPPLCTLSFCYTCIQQNIQYLDMKENPKLFNFPKNFI
jgi:hypothetical protein